MALFVPVHLYIRMVRFHACMKIWLCEYTKGALSNEQK